MPTIIEMFVLSQGGESPDSTVTFSNNPVVNSDATAEVVQSSTPDSGAEPPSSEAGGGFWIMIALLFGFMYLFVIRPEKKRQKKRTEFQSDLAKGDDVVTAGGMHGVIASLDEHTITLKISDNVRLKFDRVAVSRRASTQAEPEK
ncbi:MAG: preprotein translocase subunit YajC [Myxococcota bacterium]|jgi:preprotein translocase subunit YajC